MPDALSFCLNRVSTDLFVILDFSRTKIAASVLPVRAGWVVPVAQMVGRLFVVLRGRREKRLLVWVPVQVLLAVFFFFLIQK